MAGRRIDDEREARALLADLEEAGSIDLASFARARGIDGRSLNAWRLNLGRRARPQSADLRVVELVASSRPPPSAPTLTVRCGPFAVGVGPDVDDDLLARVLAVVASC